MTTALVPGFGKALQGAVNRAVDALVTGYGDRLDGFGVVLTAPVRFVETLLQHVPIPAFILAVAAGAWLATRRVGFALGLAGASFAFDRLARQRGLFLFLLMSTVYGYIGITYLVFHYVKPDDIEPYYWYFILTGTVLAAYLMRQVPKRIA